MTKGTWIVKKTMQVSIEEEKTEDCRKQEKQNVISSLFACPDVNAYVHIRESGCGL